MNRQEHLLVVLIEECNELAQAASKALRFGPDDRKTLDPSVVNTDRAEPTNADRMEREFSDLLAVIDMLCEDAPRQFRMAAPGEWREEKRAKVERYLLYAEQAGTLQGSEP